MLGQPGASEHGLEYDRFRFREGCPPVERVLRLGGERQSPVDLGPVHIETLVQIVEDLERLPVVQQRHLLRIREFRAEPCLDVTQIVRQRAGQAFCLLLCDLIGSQGSLELLGHVYAFPDEPLELICLGRLVFFYLRASVRVHHAQKLLPGHRRVGRRVAVRSEPDHRSDHRRRETLPVVLNGAAVGSGLEYALLVIVTPRLVAFLDRERQREHIHPPQRLADKVLAGADLDAGADRRVQLGLPKTAELAVRVHDHHGVVRFADPIDAFLVAGHRVVRHFQREAKHQPQRFF